MKTIDIVLLLAVAAAFLLAIAHMFRRRKRGCGGDCGSCGGCGGCK